jgi:hypothetical protein
MSEESCSWGTLCDWAGPHQPGKHSMVYFCRSHFVLRRTAAIVTGIVSIGWLLHQSALNLLKVAAVQKRPVTAAAAVSVQHT